MKKKRIERMDNICDLLRKAQHDLLVIQNECIDEYDELSDARQDSDYGFELDSDIDETGSFADAISDVLSDIENFLDEKEYGKRK